MKGRFLFYWVSANNTPEGVSMLWVPSRRCWLPSPEARAVTNGATHPVAWVIIDANTLRRAKWIARRSPTGAIIQRMRSVSTPTQKFWVFPPHARQP